MLEPSALAIIGVSVFTASVLSGIFGMAGGLILLGALLYYLDVVQAMVLFGAIQMTAGGWRAVLWVKHVRWPILWKYMIGATIMFVAMRYVRIVPNKAMIYIGLGLMPFAANLLPAGIKLDITRPWMPLIAGLTMQCFQLLAGATGVVLDMFFNRSGLDRKTIIGTKSVVQVVGHLFRVIYFASLSISVTAGIPWWAFLAAGALAIAGTQIAGQILERMTDEGFRAWSWKLIYGVSALYVMRGAWLLVGGD